MKIKYFIRTTLERKLDKSIYKELGEDYTLLIDYEHKPVSSFIEQLKIISDYNSILLEDDVILCKDFKNHIESVISEYPDMVINFFTSPNIYFKTHIIKGSFNFNQCTYYPHGISKTIALEMEKLNTNSLGYDVLESHAMFNLNIYHIQYRPCLVQHIDCKSLLSYKHISFRRSIYFIDYLDELNISYEDAWTQENRKKLNILMKKFFDKYE